MSQRIAIRGIGPVGGFGVGKQDLISALANVPGPNQSIQVATPDGEETFPAYLADPSSLADHVNKRKLRRIDKFSKMTVLASALALQDAGLWDDTPDRSNTGVVVASAYGAADTTFGFLDSVMNDGDACASPTLFSNSVHSAAAANVTILLGITGPGLTVSQFEMSVPIALWSACQWLREGRAEQVLFIGVDEYCPTWGYCRACYFGDGNKGPLQPLAFDQQTAVVGEGACALLLTCDDGVATPYGYIDDVDIGHLDSGAPDISADSVVLLGADGHRHCGKRYPVAIADDQTVAAYAAAYGSMPAGPAFDIAIAAMAREQGSLQATPGSNGTIDVAGRTLCSLKMSASGEYGLVRLTC